ncbi:MAG TPA: TlpA disulfide reductase family protein [Bryobacteraceae bacterium]|nr:TlpA disulfide reductase family protein [Bryobacteraceae bacterium]
MLLIILPASAAVVSDVRFKLSAGDLWSAEALVEDYYRANGANSEYAAAVSWLARGALVLGRTETAARYLNQARSLTGELLKARRVDDDSFLESAVGACIETEAQILAARGDRPQAIARLESELARWNTWWIAARIHKNLNLLTLEGQQAPELDEKYRGQPVLLFLWAHWCSDCKAQAPVIARLKEKYEARGLQVIAPTRRYGEVPKIEHPTAAQEDQEIERVWNTSYAAMGGAPHPVNDAMMLRYGVSSTPTLVLIDREGAVRMYRPTRMTEAELSRRIEALVARP